MGGGSPTFLSDDELEQLLGILQNAFRFVPGGEYAIEIDPRTIDAGRLKRLAAIGFNRLSFGVQDFDPAVQQAAMQKLFSDPHYNIMDGLDIYIDDYSKPDPIPLEMLKQLNQSQLLGLFKAPEEEKNNQTNLDRDVQGNDQGHVQLSEAEVPINQEQQTQNGTQ